MSGASERKGSKSVVKVERAWIATVHLALLDEAQQYGNIDELMTLARTAANCLVLWCGDHRQTPGGLRNTTEAKMFRRKLLARPLGLRCDTEYVQPHLLGLVIAKFMIGTVGSTAEKWASYLRGNAAVETLGAEVCRYMDAGQHQVRFTYGYALDSLDGSTYPCYCVYPERADDHSFQLVDSATGYIMAISQTESMRPLGVAHFYHAFSVNQESEEGPNFREAALQAFDLPEAAITEDKQVVMPWANQIIPAAGIARNIPAEEEDTASVISVASSGASPRQKARDSDSDASQPSEADDQTDIATVVEVPTDEDESEPESEEEFELSVRERRYTTCPPWRRALVWIYMLPIRKLR